MAHQSNERGLHRVAGQLVERLAPLRSAGWRALGQREGGLAGMLRKVNDALGRPLASEDELDDRRAFARGYRDGASFDSGLAEARPPLRMNGASPAASASEPAPVLVYFMDKQRRDATRLTEILEGHGVPYKLASLEDDPAAQAAVRRDSKGFRLPLVFVAGECVGGREQLLNAATTGALKKLVFGA